MLSVCQCDVNPDGEAGIADLINTYKTEITKKNYYRCLKTGQKQETEYLVCYLRSLFSIMQSWKKTHILSRGRFPCDKDQWVFFCCYYKRNTQKCQGYENMPYYQQKAVYFPSCNHRKKTHPHIRDWLPCGWAKWVFFHC